MQSRQHALKLTAVSALVVLALTGFSTGRGHGGGSGGGDSGGGCSSSQQDHDGGTYKEDDDDAYGGSGAYDDPYDDSSGDSGSGSGGEESTEPSVADATAKLVSCASPKTPYATVEVSNPNPVEGRFAVTVGFEDAIGNVIVSSLEEVEVPANGTVTARVGLGTQEDRAGDVTRCALDEAAPSVR
ncbi:hypothetical protein ACIF8T_13110 [Streptomyces sp. NPDC085946]|uniref:hypothetical protein n=1 Tax=Streptomyces sp. NPDC085946 TaxID=3365744 RepID=UPI0037D1EC74